LVVAAYLGRPKAWAEWTKKWVPAIRPIKVYHAVDAANLDGEFAGWTTPRVSALAARILPIIADADIAGFAVGIDLRAYRVALESRPDLAELFGQPYAACFQWLVQGVLNLADQYGNKDRIAFIHETNQYRGIALNAFDWVQKNDPQKDRVISLTFAGKRDFAPLQAADILAYEANKRMRNPSAPTRRSWDALGGGNLTASYGEQNMGELVAALEMIKAGRADEVSQSLGWNRSWAAR